jgi:alpha-beta hydrolase superfamily lysophospholipase
MTSEDLTIISKDKLTLKGKYWLPAKVQAVLCMVHGLGDHMMRHAHVAQYLAEHQIAVVLFDQRGHGTSAGKRGHISSYDALLDDIQAILTQAQKLCPDVPLFLYGHSMGGNEVANFVLKREVSSITGVIISSPWFKLSFSPSVLKVALGTMMNKIYPAFTQPNEINAQHLTHDPAVAKAYIDDTLVHKEISAGLFVGMYQAGEWAINHAAEIKIPTLVMHGSEDIITSIEATKEFVEKAGEKVTFRIWEGLRHETHNEAQREEVMQYIRNWLLQQIEKQKVPL